MNKPLTPCGTLFLVPAPLDFGCESQSPLAHNMPDETLRIASTLSHWICENAKSTRAYLKRISEIHPLVTAIQGIDLQELPREVHKKGDHLPVSSKNSPAWDAGRLLKPALDGHHMGLVSEAGMPAIADPGSSIVRAAHELNITVALLVGTVSVLLALASSGLNGQNFAFVGYVPSSPAERAQKIKELETLALKTGQTQLFIETPYRNAPLLQTLLQTLHPNTRLATASGLTLTTASIHSATPKQWRIQGWELDNTVPTVFAIGC